MCTEQIPNGSLAVITVDLRVSPKTGTPSELRLLIGFLGLIKLQRVDDHRERFTLPKMFRTDLIRLFGQLWGEEWSEMPLHGRGDGRVVGSLGDSK